MTRTSATYGRIREGMDVFTAVAQRFIEVEDSKDEFRRGKTCGYIEQ